MTKNPIRDELLIRALGGAAKEAIEPSRQYERLQTLRNMQYVPGSGPTGLLANMLARVNAGRLDLADALTERKDKEAQVLTRAQKNQALADYLDGKATAGEAALFNPEVGAKLAEGKFGQQADRAKLELQRGWNVEDRDLAHAREVEKNLRGREYAQQDALDEYGRDLNKVFYGKLLDTVSQTGQRMTESEGKRDAERRAALTDMIKTKVANNEMSLEDAQGALRNLENAGFETSTSWYGALPIVKKGTGRRTKLVSAPNTDDPLGIL